MRMSYFLATLLFLLPLLPACQPQGSLAPSHYPPIHFTDRLPYQLDVEHIYVVEEYQSPMGKPYVEHLFPIRPATAVRTWVTDRFKAKRGATGHYFRVVIKKASVIARDLPRTQGLQGLIIQDQAHQYEALLEASLEIYGKDPLFPESEMKVEVTRTHSVSEDASLNEKNALYYDMTKKLLHDFNQEVERNFESYFRKYIVD